MRLSEVEAQQKEILKTVRRLADEGGLFLAQDFLATQAKQAGERFQQLFASAQVELAEAEQAMAQGVLDLACELARQVLHQELTVNTEVLMPVLREALEMLGADCKTAVVKLHPADLIELGEQIHADFAGLSLTLRADATLQQGGCVLESAGTVIDASVPKRWQQAVSRLGMSRAWRESYESG
jgi:flagellar assembly protein FliH